jgi:dihydrodipicolinate reductase
LNNNLQSKATAVVLDFTDPSTVYDNVKQVRILATNMLIVPQICIYKIED